MSGELLKVVSGDDTIVAVATPSGRSAIGVIRLTGKNAFSIVTSFIRSESLGHRVAVVGRWVDKDSEVVDEVVITAYHGPRSYTGEDLIEIGAHGNPLILSRIVHSLQSAGARIAEPGEFTMRAVLHGKMDLLQAEAVRDFIEAQTDGQARTALRQMEGALSRRVRPLKERLIDLIARAEAGIDFVEDELELPDGRAIAEAIQMLARELEHLAGTFAYGRLLNTGLRIVIVGKPNVGKSSLFNRLVASDRAIVTEIPGTTRDVLSETVSLDGVPLRFFDTAGIRETMDRIENLGVARSRETLADADLAIVVLDGSSPMDEEDIRVLSMVKERAYVVAVNKSDLPDRIALDSHVGVPIVRLSARTGVGMEDLNHAFREFLARSSPDSLTDGILTNARQHAAVLSAAQSLEVGATAVLDGAPHEMALLDFYHALGALNELTGGFGSEDLLGRIFSTFCIGK